MVAHGLHETILKSNGIELIDRLVRNLSSILVDKIITVRISDLGVLD